MKKYKSILITGCAGFIGSHLTDEMLSAGYEVIGYDAFTYAGKESNLNNAKTYKSFTLVKGDINDVNLLSSTVKKYNIDCIINLAAETHVDNSIKSSDIFVKTNIIGAKNILDVCKEHSCLLVHFSTDEVYGVSYSGKSFDETASLNPKNPYSATKASADHMIFAYANTYKIKYIIVRPSNNFGPRQHSEKFIPTILNSIACGKKIPIYGDGCQIREWTPVTETAKATKFILENSKENEIYNISSQIYFKNKDVVDMICKELNLSIDNLVEYVPDRLGHDFRYAVCSDKLKHMGYNIFVDFKDCLKDIIETDFINLHNIVS
jgi:dTDP-glucose 4,6-dehydratase